MSQHALDLIRAAKSTRAKILDLGNCGLTELPDELFELVDLEVFYLSNEGWEYHWDLGQSFSFKSQNKGESNNIKRLSPKISQLKNLKALWANGEGRNKWDLSDLSPLKDLVNLQQLGVDNT